jgi:hypothetical protein
MSTGEAWREDRFGAGVGVGSGSGRPVHRRRDLLGREAFSGGPVSPALYSGVSASATAMLVSSVRR